MEIVAASHMRAVAVEVEVLAEEEDLVKEEEEEGSAEDHSVVD